MFKEFLVYCLEFMLLRSLTLTFAKSLRSLRTLRLIWTQKTDFGGSARIDTTGFAIANKGYIGTGNFDPPKNDFWEYDPLTNVWVQKADFGSTPRFGADGFSISGKGYIGTGYDEDSYTKDFWEYIPNEVACSIPTSLSTVDNTSTSAKLQWDAISEAIAYQVFYKSINSSQYTVLRTPNSNLTITGLTASTKYRWKVQSVCSKSPLISSEFSDPAGFITSPIRLRVFNQTVVELYPNPVSQSATLSFFLSEESFVEIEVIDLSGRFLRVIGQKYFPAGNNEVIFSKTGLSDNCEQLLPGIYLLQLKNNNEVITKKMIVE